MRRFHPQTLAKGRVLQALELTLQGWETIVLAGAFVVGDEVIDHGGGNDRRTVIRRSLNGRQTGTTSREIGRAHV